MVVIFARSWQQDNEPRSDTRYTTPSGSLLSTIHPWNPPPATSCYGTPVQTHPTLAEKNRRGERTKTKRERKREAKDWCLTVILNCKLIHRPFEINLYLEGEEDLQRASSKSIDTWPRFSIYFSLIFPDSHFPFSNICAMTDETTGGSPEVISFEGVAPENSWPISFSHGAFYLFTQVFVERRLTRIYNAVIHLYVNRTDFCFPRS